MSDDLCAPVEKGKIWIGSIVIDCTDFPGMMAFWQAALHYIPREPPEADGVVLNPEGQGPNVSLESDLRGTSGTVSTSP